MADILIRHAIVVTLDAQRRTIEDGAIAIEKDRIVAVGPDAEIAAKYKAARTIDAKGMAAIPGLIDAHAHAGHGLIKTMGGGRSDLWYKACETVYTRTSTPEFWRAEAKLAALERLRFGVTTGVSLLGGGDTILRTDDPVFGDAHCDGVVSIGTRSVVAIGTTRPPFPRTYAKRTASGEEAYPVTFERQLATCKTLVDKWHDSHGKRIRIAAITPTLRAEFTEKNDKALVEEACAQAKTVRAFSRDNGLVFTQDGHTRGSVAFANQLGLLGPDALLSHSTDLTDEEIKLTASTGTHIAHNPSAVASIMGRCPVPELLDAGANVALGSDGTAPDRSGDMFRHMQQCMHYHRRHFRDPSWLPPGRVLEMCTIDGAKALGMEKEIGSLEPGKKADVVLVDLRRPHLYPAHMPLFRIVYFANGNDVHTVIVDGVIRLEDRRAVGIDENAVLDEAQREADLMVERAGLSALLETPATFWGHTRATDQLRAH